MNTVRKNKMMILGNGGAAAHAVMAARAVGYDGEILLVSDTDSPAFNPMLAPYYLKGMLSWKQCFPFGVEFYRKYHVRCHFGSAVEHFDAGGKSVLLGNGGRLHYDQCLVATGARSIIPPVPGLQESPCVFPLRTAESALQIQKVMQSAKKAVVLGASLVGVKVAEILRKLHVEVILLDVASQLLPNGAHPHTATKLQPYFEQQGIEVRIGCSIEGMEQEGEGVCCFFPDHIMELADFVAVCTGIQPNLQFIEPGQVDIDPAILVDDHMQTSVEGLYAAGDVSQGLNRQTGKRQWLGTWANACYQGRAAGYNMAGKSASYPGAVPQHVSPFFDWTYAQIGDISRTGKDINTAVSGAPEKEGGWQLLVYEKEILVGANLINSMQDVGAIKQAIVQAANWTSNTPIRNHS